MSETLKIEAGTFWKARDGVKVFVVGRTQAGKIVIERGGAVETLHATGKIWASEPHNWDLVEPWTEPRKFKLWVYALPGIHHARGYCSQQCSELDERLVAIVEVTEGDGLKEQP